MPLFLPNPSRILLVAGDVWARANDSLSTSEKSAVIEALAATLRENTGVAGTRVESIPVMLQGMNAAEILRICPASAPPTDPLFM